MSNDTPAKSPRTYSAKTRAAAEGKENREAERIERELRDRIAAEYDDPLIYRMSDDGEPKGTPNVNASFFAALYAAKHDVIYEPVEEKLYTYNPERGLWQEETWDKNLDRVTKFLRAESRHAGLFELRTKRNLKLDRDVQAYLKGQIGKPNIFKKDNYATERFIHLRNGVFVIRDGKAEGFRAGFRKEDYSRNQIPIDYKMGADCPRLINELLRPGLPPETADEDIALFFRYMGICMLGYNLTQTICILDGAAGAGKSTLAKLIGLVCGRDENVAMLRTHLLGDRFELMACIGKTLLLGVDVKQKFLLTPGAEILKSIVGGDPLAAESKNGNARIPFHGTLNVVITSNAALRVKLEDDDDAWRRRLMVINFLPYKPERKITNFEHVLFEEEGSGIVNRALQGLLEVIDARNDLLMTPRQIERVANMLEQSEPVGQYLRDRVVKRDGSCLSKRSLRMGFAEYCNERKWARPGDHEIGSKIKKLMLEVHGVAESNSIPNPDDPGHQLAGYRGVDWSTD